MEWWLAVMGALGVGALLREGWLRFLTRGDRTLAQTQAERAYDDSRTDELYRRALEECKRHAEASEKSGAVVEELRQVFHSLQTIHIPQTTENALMRIGRARAVVKLKRVCGLIDTGELEEALTIARAVIEDLSEEVVLQPKAL